MAAAVVGDGDPAMPPQVAGRNGWVGLRLPCIEGGADLCIGWVMVPTCGNTPGTVQRASLVNRGG